MFVVVVVIVVVVVVAAAAAAVWKTFASNIFMMVVSCRKCSKQSVN